MRRRPRSSTASARRSASRPAWPCSGRSPARHSPAGAGARRRRSSRYRLRRRAERRQVDGEPGAGRAPGSSYCRRSSAAGNPKRSNGSVERKAGDLRDLGAVEREREDLMGHEALPLGVPVVGAEGRLAVRAIGHQPPAGAARERNPHQEGGDRRPALIPGRDRRHRQCGAVGEHRNHRVDIGLLPRGDKLVDDLAQRLVAQVRSVACWLSSGSRASTVLRARRRALLLVSSDTG
jgi:hypothetical protein